MCINTVYIDMNTKIAEQVVLNDDGSYTIFLNSRMTHEMQEEAYEHAIGHILNGDFEKDGVEQIELEAHGLA